MEENSINIKLLLPFVEKDTDFKKILVDELQNQCLKDCGYIISIEDFSFDKRKKIISMQTNNTEIIFNVKIKNFKPKINDELIVKVVGKIEKGLITNYLNFIPIFVVEVLQEINIGDEIKVKLVNVQFRDNKYFSFGKINETNNV